VSRLALFVLLLAAPVGAPAAEARVRTIEYLVEPGDTLSSIAAKRDVYADAYLWPVIYKFNRDQITDPSRIYPKQLLQIPIELDNETRSAARLEAGGTQD